MPRIYFAALPASRRCVYVIDVAHRLAGYQPRATEHGLLYRVIDEHLETFLDSAAQHADGQRLPKFVEQEFRDFLTCGVLEHGFARLRWQVAILRRGARFVRLNVTGGDVVLKVEMINDVPAHVGELRMHPVLGRLDSAENILANKLTAVVDRREPKDLADIWGFCCRMNLSCEGALEAAQSKAAGLFPADVARALLTVTDDDWRLVRWSDAPDRERFIADLTEIGERLLLVR